MQRVQYVFLCLHLPRTHTHTLANTLVRRLTLDVIEKVRLNNAAAAMAAAAFFKHIFYMNMGTTDE